ncbi:fungal-specific transcription factor domain-containing protein [Ilyonectria destructans]|nr:fungal-specific transcription factor domain-containing protein [Ilyonectria destructans]
MTVQLLRQPESDGVAGHYLVIVVDRRISYDTSHAYNAPSLRGAGGNLLTFHLAADERAVELDPTHSLVDSIEECVHPHGPSLVELFWRHVHPYYPITALPWSYHRPKLYSIQAALLLLQCQSEDPLNPDHTFQWGLTCQALAIGQCLGLHLDATNWIIPQWERNARKRLSWALFMQDRWTALAYGRPVHIHDDDWAVKDLTLADFTDFNTDDDGTSIAATGIMQFIQMVQLTKILSVVYSSFYTARTCCEQDTVILFKKAQPLLDRLTICYLQFSYYGVTITLLCRLIRSTALSPRCIDDHILSDIRRIALHTARSAISFITSLRPDHLKSFWYFTLPYLFSLLGSFTTLLLVTLLLLQERLFWQETLNSYLRYLRMMSKSHEPIQYAVNRLEGAILRGLEYALAVNFNEPLNNKVSPIIGNYTTDVYRYTDFSNRDLAVGDRSEAQPVIWCF